MGFTNYWNEIIVLKYHAICIFTTLMFFGILLRFLIKDGSTSTFFEDMAEIFCWIDLINMKICLMLRKIFWIRTLIFNNYSETCQVFCHYARWSNFSCPKTFYIYFLRDFFSRGEWILVCYHYINSFRNPSFLKNLVILQFFSFLYRVLSEILSVECIKEKYI